MTVTAEPTTEQATEQERATEQQSPVLIQDKYKHLHKMTPGWLFPYLVAIDQLPGVGTGRWQYWADTLLDLKLPDNPIPQVMFAQQPGRATRRPDQSAVKNIVACLCRAEQRGHRHADAFRDFVVWLLHGFGDPKFRQYSTPDQIQGFRTDPETLDYWYETFDLGLMLLRPADYMAHFSQGGENKNYNPYTGAGFFATPMSVCRMMAQMTFEGGGEQDTRPLAVNDCCCGTGSLLLAASNYSLNICGQDISYDMVNCTKVNSWLYMPWVVWWPDFSLLGGPTPAQCKAALFGKEKQEAHSVTLKQTDTGQYVMPGFFEDET